MKDIASLARSVPTTFIKDEQGRVKILDGNLGLVPGDEITYEEGLPGAQTITKYLVFSVETHIVCLNPGLPQYSLEINILVKTIE